MSVIFVEILAFHFQKRLHNWQAHERFAAIGTAYTSSHGRNTFAARKIGKSRHRVSYAYFEFDSKSKIERQFQILSDRLQFKCSRFGIERRKKHVSGKRILAENSF